MAAATSQQLRPANGRSEFFTAVTSILLCGSEPPSGLQGARPRRALRDPIRDVCEVFLEEPHELSRHEEDLGEAVAGPVEHRIFGWEGFCGQGRPIRRVVQVAAMHHTRRCCCNGQSSNGVNMPRPNKTKLGYGRNRSLQTCRRTVGQLPSQRHCIGWSSHKTPLHTSVPLPDRQWPDGRQTHLGSRAVCPWETCRVVDAKLSSAETMGPTERAKDKNVASKRGQRPPWSGIFSP